MEDILREFDPLDTLDAVYALWEALHFAWKNWPEGLDYVVFLGDDTVDSFLVDTVRTSYYGYTIEGHCRTTGPVPTWTYGERISCRYVEIEGVPDTICDTTCELTDDYYLTIVDSAPPTRPLRGPRLEPGLSAPVFGRIPCESSTQCDRYVDKLMRFDTAGTAGPWRNRLLAVADDFYIGETPDPIRPPHYTSAESVSASMAGRRRDRVYAAEYPTSAQGQHDQARDAYFDLANKGYLWTIYAGHGHPNQLTDERMLAGDDWVRFRNDTHPTIFLSLSCSNGALHLSIDRSMCKRFLFSPPGGALAYIASANLAYVAPNERIGKYFMSHQAANPGTGLGRSLSEAKTIEGQYSSNIAGFYFLGDPALVPSAPQTPITANLQASPAGDMRIAVSFPDRTGASGRFDAVWVVPDTVPFTLQNQSAYYVREAVVDSIADSFSDGILLHLPSNPASQRLILYAWGDDFEARLDSSWQAPPAAASGIPEIVCGRWALKTKGHILSIIPPADAGTSATLLLFDMRGRRLYRSVVSGRSGTVEIDPTALDIPSGPIAVKLQTSEGVVNLTALFVR